MSEKKLEECSLEQATHVEMGGKMYKFGKEYTSEQDVLKYNDCHIDLSRGITGWHLIHVDVFPILGIKPMKEKEPIEFEFIPSLEMAKDMWLPADFIVPMEAVGKKFKCVEIVEDEK
jgi:hypothetical protein